MVNVRRGREGFTMVELAIVLVVIGLIITMGFKGKQLIDSAKVKNLAAQYNKIVSALNIYYERYGSYPGDGCTTATPAGPSACTGVKDGIIQSSENAAAWYLLIDVTGILSQNDRMSVFGQPWNFWNSGSTVGPVNPQQTYLDLPGQDQLDARIICALDKLIDDGISNTGIVLAATGGLNLGNQLYNQQTDCWSLNTQTDAWIRVLP